MKIKHIEIETGLDFTDVQKYIPTITTDNKVVSDGEIIRFELVLNNNKKQNIFIDCVTGEYCFSSKYNLDNVGGVIQSRLFKNDQTYDFLDDNNMEWLMLDILAEEV